jgi:hypothetical protein
MPSLGAGWTTPSGTTGVQVYAYGSSNPTTTAGAQSVTVANNAGATAAATITLVDDSPPVLAASGGTTAATENVAIVVDSGITVTDPDTANMASGTVTVGSGYTAGQDVLSFTNQNGITGSYSAPTLTLTGSATKAFWQTALRSITYTNTSGAPNTGTRTINFVVDDGVFGSNTAAKSVSVAAVNDAPVNGVPGAQSAVVGVPEVFSTGNSDLISISDVDAAASSVQVQLVSVKGTTSLSGTTGLSFSVGDGTADTTMTFTGTITAINTALSGLAYTATVIGAGSLQIVTSDLGNTGTGGTLTDNDTIAITNTDPPFGIFSAAANVGAGAGTPTSTSYSSATGVYNMVGNGTDITNTTSDQFYYIYKSFTGDGTIIARVTAMGANGQQFAKAAVMFRESTAAGSSYVRLDTKRASADGVEVGYRTSTNGTAASTNYPGPQPIDWLKIVRSGNSFTQWSAPDSSGSPGAWTQRGTAKTVTMASTILVGLAVCAHSSGTMSATFDNVSVS